MVVIRQVPLVTNAHSAKRCQCISRMPPRVRRMLTPADRLRDLKIVLRDLAGPAAVLDAARRVVEGGPEHRQSADVGRGRRQRAGELARERRIIRADDGGARRIVERVDRALRRLVGIAEGAGCAGSAAVIKPPAAVATSMSRRDSFPYEAPGAASTASFVNIVRRASRQRVRQRVRPLHQERGLLHRVAHRDERAWPPKSTQPSDVHIVQYRPPTPMFSCLSRRTPA